MSTIVTNFYSTVILHHVVGLARETPNGICREEEIYGKELAHTVREVEKSLNLPSARWRPRKAGGVIQPKSEKQEHPGEEIYVPAQAIKQERANSSFCFLF